MRGSLNRGYRRHELERITQGNKDILMRLRKVKPGVGTIEEWKQHELKSIHRKKHIEGMQLDRKYRNNNFTSNLNNTINFCGISGADSIISAPYSIGLFGPDMIRANPRKIQLPKLSYQEQSVFTQSYLNSPTR